MLMLPLLTHLSVYISLRSISSLFSVTGSGVPPHADHD
jgi:hypothetical protein